MAFRKKTLKLLIGLALSILLFSYPHNACGQISWKKWGVGESIHAVLDPLEAKARPNEVIVFRVSDIADDDYYITYVQDEKDESKLPIEMPKKKERDICTLEWYQEGGRFEIPGHGPAMEWRAPKEAGTYEVGVIIDDMALIRVPDRGDRDDEALKLGATVTVSGIAGLTLWLIIVAAVVLLAAFIAWFIFYRLKKTSEERE